MDVVQATARGQAAEVLSRWADSFSSALASGDAARTASLFAPDGYWRDILALGWSYRTFAGQAQIEAAVAETAAPARPREFRLAVDRMAARLKARPGILDLRRQIVEHPFGSIKQWMYQGAFLMRRLEKVRAEFSLTALAYNLRRALNIVGVEVMIAAVAA